MRFRPPLALSLGMKIKLWVFSYFFRGTLFRFFEEYLLLEVNVVDTGGPQNRPFVESKLAN